MVKHHKQSDKAHGPLVHFPLYGHNDKFQSFLLNFIFEISKFLSVTFVRTHREHSEKVSLKKDHKSRSIRIFFKLPLPYGRILTKKFNIFLN